jgi:hypothetical protein
MSALADDVAAHDWSAAGAEICGKPGRSVRSIYARGLATARWVLACFDA